jgi:hypothetical protein
VRRTSIGLWANAYQNGLARPSGLIYILGVLFTSAPLVENRQRLRQAARNIKTFLAGRNDTPDLRRGEHGLTAAAP